MGVTLCDGARKWVWHCVMEQGSGCGIVWWSKEVGVALCGGAIRKWVWQGSGCGILCSGAKK